MAAKRSKKPTRRPADKTATSRPRHGAPSRRRRRGLFGPLLKWSAVAAVWLVVVGLLAGAWFASGLPDLADALETTRRPTVTVLAADGTTLYRGGDLYGQPQALDRLPPALIAAVLATEDRRFYSHFGLDPIGLIRAAWANAQAGRIVQGGSTLTQQLAKNLFLTPARTIERKVQEAMLALWLEQTFSKDEILTLYLNRVYLGAGTYGVEAAARRYFNKPASRLATYQAAQIAGLLKAPSRYNPRADRGRAHGRTLVVLGNMVRAGYLTRAQADRAAAGQDPAAAARAAGTGAKVRRDPRDDTRLARHFVDWVMDALPGFVAPDGRDLMIKTTLVPDLQRAARRAMTAALAAGRQRQATEAALVAMAPNGAVRALVGGGDYRRSQFNRAVQARRQPGSAFKPIVYLAALERGLAPDTVIDDRPVQIGDWRPRNFSGRHVGPVDLGRALAQSINTVAVRLAQRAGPGHIVKTARRLGISSDLPADAGLALGTGEVTLMELTAAYAVFAGDGMGVWPHAITEIADGDGRILYRRAGSGPGRVVDVGPSRRMTAMMTGVIADGTGRRAAIGRPAAGKTGTSQDHRDAWFLGFTPDLVAGVWIGNDNATPMQGVTGGGLPARAWRDFMAAAHRDWPLRDFPVADVAVPGPPARDAAAGSAAAIGQGFWRRLAGVLDSPDPDRDRGGD